MYGFGFLLGFSPWLLFNWYYGWWGANFAYLFLSEEASPYHWFSHIPLLIKYSLSRLFSFRKLTGDVGFWPGGFFAGIYFLSLFHLGLQQFQNRFEVKSGFQIKTFGFFFQIFLIALVLLSRGSLYESYLLPMVPFIGMTLILGMESLGRRTQIFLVVFFFGIFLQGNLNLVHWSEMGRTLSLPVEKRSEGDILFTLETKFGHDLDLFQQKSRLLLTGESPELKRTFYEGLSKDFFQIRNINDLKKALSIIQEIEPELQSILYDRLGIGLGFYTHFDPNTLQELFKEFQIPSSMQGPVYAGFIQGLNWANYSREERLEKGHKICGVIPTEDKSFCQEGLKRLDR